MEKEIEIKENEYKIVFNTNNSKFYLYIHEEGNWLEYNSYNSFELAQQANDRRYEIKKRKITPLNVLKKSYNENFVEGRITSIEKSRYGTMYCWFTSKKDKKRSKDSSYDFYKDNEKNTSIQRQIGKLKDDIRGLEEQYEKITEEELKEYFKEIMGFV